MIARRKLQSDFSKPRYTGGAGRKYARNERFSCKNGAISASSENGPCADCTIFSRLRPGFSNSNLSLTRGKMCVRREQKADFAGKNRPAVKPGGGGNMGLGAGENQGDLEQVAVHQQLKLTFLQLHETLGNVQSQTAALGVPGQVTPDKTLQQLVGADVQLLP